MWRKASPFCERHPHDNHHMITPKFRELMVAGASEHWMLRFWFSVQPDEGHVMRKDWQTARRVEADDAVARVMADVERYNPATLDDIEDIICELLRPEDHCAAAEVLNGDTLNGTVLYFEWP